MATNNAVNTSLAGQTGTGTFVGATSPTLVTPVLGAASATSLSFSSTSGIIGTTTNNNAAAGSVGQLISSVVTAASGITFTTNVAANVTSISLTAGDWDVIGNVTFIPVLTTTRVYITDGWISLTSATLPDQSLYASLPYVNTGFVSSTYIGFNVPSLRVSISGTTTVYLSILGAFDTSTLKACGGIYARRVR